VGDSMSDPSSFPLSAPRFVTPDQKYVVDNTPHTPTPFKNALEKYGPIRPLVSVGQVCHLLGQKCNECIWDMGWVAVEL